MSKRYNVNEFLHDKNKIKIENEIENSNDHNDDDIDLKWNKENQQLKQ